MRARTVAIECGTSRSVIGAFAPTPDGGLMLEAYALVERPEASEAAWPELPREMERARRYVALPPPNLTLTKVIELPPASRAQQERVVKFEAAEAIPRPLAELAWGWMPLGDDGRAVLLAATKAETAEALARAAEAAGVRLEAVVPRAAALLRAWMFNYPEETGAAVVAEVDGGTALLASRDAGRGAVRLVGLPTGVPVAAGAGEVGPPLGEDVRWRRLVAEAARLLERAEETDGARPLPTLYLAGPDAPAPETIERHAGAAFAGVARFNPLRRVRLGAGAAGAAALAHRFGPVVGAALCVDTPRRPGPNLLPLERRRENAFRRNRGRWLVGLGLAAAVALAATVGVRSALARALQTEAGLTREIRPWREAQQTVVLRRREIEACQRELVTLRALEAARPWWAAWFGAWQEQLERAGGVWIESVGPAPEAGSGVVPPFAAGTGGAVRSGGVRLAIAGAALDPGLDGRRGLERVRVLLGEWAAAGAVQAVEGECFDTAEPGVLRFGCVLVLKPEAGP